tara:strand:- start:295 stop:423 length:129 start_codon:yes stop_codon:yes gene_type:complete
MEEFANKYKADFFFQKKISEVPLLNVNGHPKGENPTLCESPT